MAIREVKVSDTHDGLRFPEHQLAHQLLDGLEGIEIGAGAHNSFGLAGSINVSPGDDVEVFRKSEVKLCGSYADIDVQCDGIDLLKFFPKNSKGYIISSHAFEHFPDPIQALMVWVEVLKSGGYIFMIVPKRDALDSDKERPLSTWDDWQQCHNLMATVDNWNGLFPNNQVARRGHYHVYTPDSLIDLVGRFDQAYGTELHIPGLDLVAREDSDTKVGNGFTLVFKVNKLEPATGSEFVAAPESAVSADEKSDNSGSGREDWETDGGSTGSELTGQSEEAGSVEPGSTTERMGESSLKQPTESTELLESNVPDRSLVDAKQTFDKFVDKNPPPSNIAEFVEKHETPKRKRGVRK